MVMVATGTGASSPVMGSVYLTWGNSGVLALTIGSGELGELLVGFDSGFGLGFGSFCGLGGSVALAGAGAGITGTVTATSCGEAIAAGVGVFTVAGWGRFLALGKLGNKLGSMRGLAEGSGLLRELGLVGVGAGGLERNQPKGSNSNRAIAEPERKINTNETMPAMPMEKSSSSALGAGLDSELTDAGSAEVGWGGAVSNSV
jgi:hypothetical protein